MPVPRTPLCLLLVALFRVSAVCGQTASAPQNTAAKITFAEGVIPKDGRAEILEVSSGVLVVVVFDSSSRPLGLMKLQPRVGEKITVKELPTPERSRGQLGLTLSYPSKDDPAGALHDIRLELLTSERRLPADAVVDANGSLRAFWFAAPSGDATVGLASKIWAPERPLVVSVPERHAALPSAVGLLRRPTLRVRLAGGDRLPKGGVSVEVFACDKQKEFVSSAPHLDRCETPVARTEPADREFTFTGLLPGTFAYRWRKESLSAAGWIEVPDFSDVEKQIDVEVFEVSGRVERHGDGVAAHLVFESPSSSARAEADTDEQGRYRVVVAEKSRYAVRIRTEGFLDFPAAIDVAGDTHRDFELPANRYVVRVQSAEDGKPLAKARVDYEVGSASWNSRNDPLSAKGFTGEDGSLELPPVPEGQLKVTVRIVGYRPGEAPPVRVESTSEGGDIFVSLKKSPSVAIRLVEPEGVPARGGFIWTAGGRGAPPTADDGSTIFDGDLAPGAPFFAFDGRGRMAFTRWSGEREQVIEIQPSGPPVTIRFQNSAGQPIKRLVRVGVDDVIMFEGPFSQQVTWSGSQWSSGADGIARIVGLPARGTLTVFPGGRPDIAVTRPLPVTEEIVVTVPGADPPRVRVAKEAMASIR